MLSKKCVKNNERKVITTESMEDFLKSYMHLKTIDQLDRNNDIALFKKGYQPLWESCKDGGFWFYRFTRTRDPNVINYYWEKIIFALIGEQFDEPNILGAILSIRGRETIIELWVNYFQSETIKNKVAEKFRALLNSEVAINFYFKDIMQSIHDKSTLKGAETHAFINPRKFTYG